MKIQALLIAAAFTIAAPFSHVLAGYNFKMSTSPTDHDAGSTLVLNGIGDTGSLYVWASTDPGETLNGISLDIVAQNPGVASGVSHATENPGIGLTRWTAPIGEGDLNAAPNLIVSDTNAVNLIFATGLQSLGQTDFHLHSTITVEATGIGATGIELEAGGLGILYTGSTAGSSFSGATITAVPEPSSITALIGGAVCFTLRRRRKLG